MNEQETKPRVTVVVCIAEPLLRVGVCASLADEADMEVMGPDSISSRGSIDVVIADWSTALKITENGPRFELCQGIRVGHVLAIALQAREQVILSAMEQGVDGFVLTSSPIGELLAGVRAVARGSHYLCQSAAHLLDHITEHDVLTDREGEVLRLVAKGLCNKAIACDLGIAVGTVKAHVKSIMFKLGAGCRTEAVSIATERGIVEVPAPSSRRLKSHPYAAWLGRSMPRSSCA